MISLWTLMKLKLRPSLRDFNDAVIWDLVVEKGLKNAGECHMS